MESRRWVLEARDPRTDLKQRFVYNVDQIREEEDSAQQRGHAPQLAGPLGFNHTQTTFALPEDPSLLGMGLPMGGTQPKTWGERERGEMLGSNFLIDWISGVLEREDSLAYDLGVRWTVVPSINQKKGTQEGRGFVRQGI